MGKFGKIIAHRSNLNGPKPKRENTFDAILRAVASGFMTEVDVYKIGYHYFLGHDEDNLGESVSEDFFENDSIIVHAKNEECLNSLSGNPRIHLFYQDAEHEVITTKGLIWNHSANLKTGKNRILTFLGNRNKFEEIYGKDVECYGICTDYPESFLER